MLRVILLSYSFDRFSKTENHEISILLIKIIQAVMRSDNCVQEDEAPISTDLGRGS